MESGDPNEFQVPSTPPGPPSDTEYQSGNPSQYASALSDSDSLDDPSYKASDEEKSDPFVDDFPSQLTNALLPFAKDEGEEKLTLAAETWLNFNADEIELVDSLKDKADQDLGTQLVNAHGLKRSRWDVERIGSGEVKGWHNKRRWQKDVPDEEEARAAFERDDTWGAWPLEPWVVPREDEKDAVDEWRWREGGMSVKDMEGGRYKPSGDMEDVLTATGVRYARERFEARRWKANDEITSDMEREEREEFRQRALEMELDPDEELERVKHEHDDEAVEEEAERNRFRWLRDRREPVVDTDDDRSAVRMRVPVRHALARLDDLLMALRKNRAAGDEILKARNAERSRDGSATGSVTSGYATDTTDWKSQTRKLVKKSSIGPGRPKKRKLQDIPEYVPEYKLERVKGKRGRPRMVPIPQHGETQEEAMIRLARFMKKKAPVLHTNLETEPKIKEEEVEREDVIVQEEGISENEERHTANKGNLSPELIGTLEEQTMLEEAEAAAAAAGEFTPLSQDDIKHSDSDDPAREEYIKDQYDHWPYPKETWPERVARRREKKEAEEAEQREWEMRYANRDWSDVVGLASIIGFPPKVVQRTVERLTGLLGEGMDLRVFTRLEDREAETLVQYKPDKIPSDDGLFDASGDESSEEGEDDGHDDEDEMDNSFDTTTTSSKPPSRHSRSSSKASLRSVAHIKDEHPANRDSDNSLSSSSNYSSSSSDSESAGHICPIENCGRHMPGREISSQKALRAHLRKRHDWGEYEIEEYYEETSDEDEMIGGVLRDGFLKRIKVWSAYDKRRGDGSSEEEEEDEATILKSRISPEL